MKSKRMTTLAALLAIAAFMPLVAANATTGHHGGSATRASSCSSRPTACARTRSPSTPTRATLPGFRDMLRHGAYASDNGLLTQAPPNTGAGWFTLATGAWPGVHGSTNNTFHINGPAFAQLDVRAAGSTGVLQAETLAQAAERGGKKVAQIEWAGGRSGTINGPDARLPQLPFGPRRGDELHRAVRHPVEHHRLRAAVRHGLRPTPATGWTNVPTSYSPAMEMHMRGVRHVRRRRERQVRPQRLHLRLQERRQDALRPRAVLAHQERRPTPSGTFARARSPTSR